ncbi:MAG: GNAT family N-acetyltransferase, partial [Neisseriaceae bacterium]|nr:GNAT family N-acetyltransferase [Neisseriaceae bacterium]
VTLIARIAVNKIFQGKGFGRKLLFLSLKQALKLNNNGLPTYAVVLDILDNDAKEFYKKFNFFQELDNSGKKLFVPMKVVRKLFA